MQAERITAEDARKTGTTTLGMVCKDCVVVAAESKVTMGYLVSSKEFPKLYQIDDRIVMTVSGGVGDAQSVVRILKAEINIYKLTRNAELTIKGVSTLLANIQQNSRFYPYMLMPIIAGFDRTGTRVFSVDPAGGIGEDAYTSTGSGSPFAYGVLEDGYRKDMTREEGIDLAVRAIKAARERDIASGGKNIDIAVIDKNGTEFLRK
ncbi:MAG TPA: archaeal proteasome endopeptidase complex subunit beta [archaeon]|nr:archaeal proteasome endopeptidase complex subunit beta [archaeon]